MSEEKTRPWLFIVLICIAGLMAFAGASKLYQDSVSILGYLLLGLGLGGFVAGLGEVVGSRKKK